MRELGGDEDGGVVPSDEGGYGRKELAVFAGAPPGGDKRGDVEEGAVEEVCGEELWAKVISRVIV